MAENSQKKYKHKRTWKKTPTVFQMENCECGAASLAMILAYFGHHASLEQLRVDCGVSKDGCNALNIFKAAKKHGLKVKAYKYDVKDLIEQTQPCIIHWNFNHFVVYEGIKNGSPYINDPANGRRKISYEELSDSFTGIVLLFEKDISFKKISSENTVLDFLFRGVAKQKATLAMLIIIGILLVVLGFLNSTFSKVFIDSILIPKNFSLFLPFAIAMLLVLLFNFAFSNLKNFLINKLQLKLSVVYGYQLIEQTLKLPISFYEQRYAGDISQRIGNNDNANSFISGRLTGIFLDIFSAIFYLIFMIIYNFQLTVIGLIGLCISLFITYKIINIINENVIKLTQDSGKLSGLLFSGVEISSTIKASGIENKFLDKIISHYSSMASLDQKIGRVNEIIAFLPGLVIQATNIIIIIFGAYFVIQGDFTMGMLSAFGVLFGSFTAPVNSLFGLFRQFQDLKANILRVKDIENHKKDDRFIIKEKTSDEIDEKINGNIQVENIEFGYSEVSEPIIKDFSLNVNSGEIVALVGPSGCGKSTVLKLLGGLYKPWNGQILFDKKNAYEYEQSILNSSVSSINQDTVIFSGSIKDNLTLWNPHVLNNDLINAAKDACIYDVITQMSEGFNHELSQGGKNLSGGQMQRIEITRALINNPSILLMDEATSALDPIIEKNVLNNIKKRGCTCVIVAHRLSTIRDADKIVCIDNGKVVQSGTHSELKEKEGLYKELIKNL